MGKNIFLIKTSKWVIDTSRKKNQKTIEENKNSTFEIQLKWDTVKKSSIDLILGFESKIYCYPQNTV